MKARAWPQKLLSLFMPLALLGCGSTSSSGGSNGPAYGDIERNFRQAALEHNIPPELLLAVAYNESRISSKKVSTSYSNQERRLGLAIGETAFGLSYQTLALPPTSSSENLETQINAYSKWVSKRLEQKKIDLPSNLANADTLYDWVWQLALLHRNGNDNRKNVQIVFASELIETLNQGFTWQDDSSSERITLPARNPPISSDAFSKPIQRNLQLDLQKSEIFSVDYMQLSYEQTSSERNDPEAIRVIHCPFSLSACLEIQNRESDTDEIRLQAHYIIPADQSLVENHLKVRQHRSPVLLTNNKGQTELIQNAVIIMLVGNSGRYVEGVRLDAVPTWYSNYQLKNLGKIIQGSCELMRQDNPDIDLATCRSPGIPGGVQFQTQGNSEQFHLGDIADFDKDIFWTYVQNPDELGGQVAFNFPVSNRSFQAGNPINFQLQFITGTAKTTIELLQRCENDKLVWTTLQTGFIRNSSQANLQLNLFSQGPNQNGQHFLRAQVFDQNNVLKGWAIESIFLNGYDSEVSDFASLEDCAGNEL